MFSISSQHLQGVCHNEFFLLKKLSLHPTYAAACQIGHVKIPPSSTASSDAYGYDDHCWDENSVLKNMCIYLPERSKVRAPATKKRK